MIILVNSAMTNMNEGKEEVHYGESEAMDGTPVSQGKSRLGLSRRLRLFTI